MEMDEIMRLAKTVECNQPSYQFVRDLHAAIAKEEALLAWINMEARQQCAADDSSAAKEVLVEGAVKAIVDAVSGGISLGRSNRESLGRALERDAMNSAAGRAIGGR